MQYPDVPKIGTEKIKYLDKVLLPFIYQPEMKNLETSLYSLHVKMIITAPYDQIKAKSGKIHES